MRDWKIFSGTGLPSALAPELPEAPGWRQFSGEVDPLAPPPPADDEETSRRLGPVPVPFLPDSEEVKMVNAAIHLRRALLVTGKPGVGKSTLAHLVARELGFGAVLRWPITTRSTLQDGLYRYDAVGRLHASQLQRKQTPPSVDRAYDEIGRFIQLGPLGTALLPSLRPRVLLIDEIDKSDLDFPNDLLNVLEDGDFAIPELARYEARGPVRVRTADRNGSALVRDGRVACREFPLIFMTSNGEKEFPPAFLRRCQRLEMSPPDPKRLASLVKVKLGGRASTTDTDALIEKYFDSRDGADRAADQLLNALFIIAGNTVPEGDRVFLFDQLLRPLGGGQ